MITEISPEAAADSNGLRLSTRSPTNPPLAPSSSLHPGAAAPGRSRPHYSPRPPPLRVPSPGCPGSSPRPHCRSGSHHPTLPPAPQLTWVSGLQAVEVQRPVVNGEPEEGVGAWRAKGLFGLRAGRPALSAEARHSAHVVDADAFGPPWGEVFVDARMKVRVEAAAF